jgi:uncharacterized membrane protein
MVSRHPPGTGFREKVPPTAGGGFAAPLFIPTPGPGPASTNI